MCEKLVVNVDGNHSPFTSSEIVTPDPTFGLGVGARLDENGDILGSTSEGARSSARLSVSAAAVSTLDLSHQIVKLGPNAGPGGGGPNGAVYQVCFSMPLPVLKLTKTASAESLTVGQPASYTLTLENTSGVRTTAQTVIRDDFPASLRLGAMPPGCTASGQFVTCLVPGGTETTRSFIIPVTPTDGALPSVKNTAVASGGGDAACTGSGACMSTVTTPVTRPPAITSTKTASANPLLAGVAGQFYTVAVTVANRSTTTPLLIEDTLPPGILLAGAPVLIAKSTTGVLRGCPATGSVLTGCSVDAGVAPGIFEIQIPVQLDGTSVGAQAGTNTVNLNGGGDGRCTPAINDFCDARTLPIEVRLGVPKVRIVKEAAGGSGTHRFEFALSGLSVASDTITMAVPGRGVGLLTITGTAGVPARITERSPAGWPVNPVSASCRDMQRATGQAALVEWVGNTLTIPSEWMVAGADIECTFVNSGAFVVTGRVFIDNGGGSGQPNDGVANGGEAGLAGVRMGLTNCAAGVLSTAVTDGAGRYGLEVPFSMVAGDAVCVEETTPTGYLSTGASVGSTGLPTGVGVNSGGKTYVYMRTASGTSDHIAFTWDGNRASELNFGDVPFNRFGADSIRTGSPGSSVSHAHTFVAQTGGAVSFGVASAVAMPPTDGWSAKIYADPGCTGALQAGAAVLYPPAIPTTVTAGQNVCVVVQEFIPANAQAGDTGKRTVEASFVFTNASPGLSASYLALDTTTVSSTALELRKEVRNATKDLPFGLNNEARSGEVLEYRIIYTNTGPTPIGGLTVNDTTPVYTSFAGSLEETTPATLTGCTKHTPANPFPAPAVACATAQAVGGTGGMNWKFNGQLAPGGTGAVRFRVTVN